MWTLAPECLFIWSQRVIYIIDQCWEISWHRAPHIMQLNQFFVLFCLSQNAFTRWSLSLLHQMVCVWFVVCSGYTVHVLTHHQGIPACFALSEGIREDICRSCSYCLNICSISISFLKVQKEGLIFFIGKQSLGTCYKKWPINVLVESYFKKKRSDRVNDL